MPKKTKLEFVVKVSNLMKSKKEIIRDFCVCLDEKMLRTASSNWENK